MKAPGAVLLAPSPTDFSQYDAMYYIKGAAAGGICCSITHAALTPVDVVKTRVQLDPVKVRSPQTSSPVPLGILSNFFGSLLFFVGRHNDTAPIWL